MSNHHPNRPRVPDVVPIAVRFLTSEHLDSFPYNALHVVLEDPNYETHHVLACLESALDLGDVDAAALALILLAMSPTQRSVVASKASREVNAIQRRWAECR